MRDKLGVVVEPGDVGRVVAVRGARDLVKRDPARSRERQHAQRYPARQDQAQVGAQPRGKLGVGVVDADVERHRKMRPLGGRDGAAQRRGQQRGDGALRVRADGLAADAHGHMRPVGFLGVAEYGPTGAAL